MPLHCEQAGRYRAEQQLKAGLTLAVVQLMSPVILLCM